MAHRTDLTIVIPAYNVGRFVLATLAHALRIADAPILVVNDASQDETARAVTSMIERHGSRIRLVENQQNLGMTGNWRRAFDLVESPLALKLDADDIIVPGYVARAVELMQRRPDVAIIGASGSHRIGPDELLDPSDAEVSYEPRGDIDVFEGDAAVTRAFNWHPFPTSGSTIYRMSDYRTIGGFNPRLRVCSDWDMWLRFSRCRALAIDPAVGLLYRHHPTSVLREAVGKASLAHDWHAMIDDLRRDWTDSPMHPRLRKTYRFVARRHLGSAWRRARSGDAADATGHLRAAFQSMVRSLC